MLADQLATGFTRVEPECLHWARREPLIQAELRRADADILVMEEVDHYEDSLEPFMRPLGYDGFFQKKQGWHRDGTAIFYRRDKIALISSQVVTYTGQTQFYVMLRCRLRTDKEFVVVGTHLNAKLNLEETRLAEVHQLLAALEPYQDQPILLLGDFNSLPTQTVYPALSSSALGLRSAYFGVLKEGAEPEFTSYKYRERLIACTIDYIWASRSECVAVMSIPSPQDIGPKGLPNEAYPSDHFALVCDLALH